ncbi:MAG TPA: hypothetical protein VF784_13215 [Anaerolineales bacterium]
MKRPSRPLLLVIGVSSLLLAFFLREAVYQLIVVPLAYVIWIVQFYYSAIPQWVLWASLLALLFLAVLWSLVPEAGPAARRAALHIPPEGQVEALADWIRKGRRGNYFKWRLANRLGRIARGLDESAGLGGRFPSADEAVERYLDAGLNYSFVDFPRPRNRFRAAPKTPLDVDPNQVADYLESQMEKTSDRRG